MPDIVVTTLSGEEVVIEGQLGVSVMEHIRAAQLEELLALCGGCRACGTCHVYVDDPAFAARLPPMSDDEDELLESQVNRRPNSRLSCQIPFKDDLSGLRVTIASQD